MSAAAENLLVPAPFLMLIVLITHVITVSAVRQLLLLLLKSIRRAMTVINSALNRRHLAKLVIIILPLPRPAILINAPVLIA